MMLSAGSNHQPHTGVLSVTKELNIMFFFTYSRKQSSYYTGMKHNAHCKAIPKNILLVS